MWLVCLLLVLVGLIDLVCLLVRFSWVGWTRRLLRFVIFHFQRGRNTTRLPGIQTHQEVKQEEIMCLPQTKVIRLKKK